jgi:hypothetical protein
MIYRALGALFSHSNLSIAFAEFHENAGLWRHELKTNKSYSGTEVNQTIQQFIEENHLQYQVALITVHSETGNAIFNGAIIAAATGLPVITDLTSLDIELGGNGQFYKTCAQKLGFTEEPLTELNKTICVSFMGILRWREEYNFLSSATGASRNSIGGAIWLGQEA